MKKVLLFVVNDAGFFLSHRLNIARAARAAGWTVHVATPDGPHVPTIKTEGFRHHVVRFSRSGASPIHEARTVWALFRLFRTLRPNLVHAVTIKPVIYVGITAPLAGVPAVVQAVSGLGHVFISRGVVATMRRMLVRLAYMAAFRYRRSRVIFQNPDDRKSLGRAIRQNQAILIPGAGVDPDEFSPCLEPKGMPVVVMASRMLWAKGVGEFVDAARELRDKGIGARFVLVGESDQGNPAAVPESQLRAWAESGVVEWWGQRNDISSVFSAAHVVCLPSYREGLPKVLIEAIASGRPVVTTDVPGCREIVRNGENGFLVPPYQSRALAEALDQLIHDGALRAKMGMRGREIFLKDFTTERIVRDTLGVYEKLMRDSGAVGSETRVSSLEMGEDG